MSGTKLTRDMEEIVRCGDGTRTIVFPRLVQRMGERACICVESLASVVINDGLRELKGNYVDEEDLFGDHYTTFCSPFYMSAI